MDKIGGSEALVFLNGCLGDDLSNIEGISLGFNSAQTVVARIRRVKQKEIWEWILLRALNSVVLQLKIIFISSSAQLIFYGYSPLGLSHEFISRCGDNCCATCRNNKVACILVILHSLNCVCLIMTLIVNIQISDYIYSTYTLLSTRVLIGVLLFSCQDNCKASIAADIDHSSSEKSRQCWTDNLCHYATVPVQL